MEGGTGLGLRLECSLRRCTSALTLRSLRSASVSTSSATTLPSQAKQSGCRDGQTQTLPLNCAAGRAGLAAERKEAAAHRASLGTARWLGRTTIGVCAP